MLMFKNLDGVSSCVWEQMDAGRYVYCVHCIGMKATYFSDSFFYHLYLSINPQTHQSHKKESQHPNDTSDYKDKTNLNLHQKIQEKLVCSAAYLSVNTFVFKQQSFHSEVMERSYFISGDNKIITPGKKVYLCTVTSSK